jgi:3-hydroxybutyryl-CoA dehydratase
MAQIKPSFIVNPIYIFHVTGIIKTTGRASAAVAGRSPRKVGTNLGRAITSSGEKRIAKTVGEADVTLFAGLTGDFSDTHINEQYMQEKSSIGTRIAHGALLVGYMSTASTISIAHVIHRTDLDEFPVSAGYDRIRFIRPVLLGDTVTVIYRVAEIDEQKRRSIADMEVINQRNEVVAAGRHIMKWAKKLSSN